MPSVVAPSSALSSFAAPFTMIDDKDRLAFERDRQLALKKADIQKAKQKAFKADALHKSPSAPSRTTARQDVKRDAALDGKDASPPSYLDVHDLVLQVDEIALEHHYTFVEDQEFLFTDFVVEQPLSRQDDSAPATPAHTHTLLDPSLGFSGAHSWFITEAQDGCAHLTTPPPTYSVVTLLKREW